MISGYIDRFEDNLAVISLEDGAYQIDIPRKMLAEDLNEGDYVCIAITFDAERTKNALQEAMALMND